MPPESRMALQVCRKPQRTVGYTARCVERLSLFLLPLVAKHLALQAGVRECQPSSSCQTQVECKVVFPRSTSEVVNRRVEATLEAFTTLQEGIRETLCCTEQH
jgi:hypothetical protein